MKKSDKSENRTPDQPHVVALVQRLSSLGFAPGEQLPSESELAAMTHFGRPQVREALRVLEAFGAVRSRRGARRVWLGLDADLFGDHLAAALGSAPRTLHELFEIRHAFEIMHLPQVIASMSSSHEAELRAITAEMVEHARRSESIHEVDERFHRRLFAQVGNRLFDGVSAAFWRLHTELGRGPSSGENLLSVAAMHVSILDLVCAREVRRAVHELDAHFWGVRTRIAQVRTPEDPHDPGRGEMNREK